MSARDEYGSVPQTIPAADVEPGDFLPGLDMGYVFTVETGEVRAFSAGSQNILLGTFVTITFHTSDGDEAYLIVPEDVPVTIERRPRR